MNYYWNGTNPLIPIKNSESGTETYGKTVNPDTDVPGYTLVPGQTTSLEIKDDPDQPNVLNLYYYKNVKLKANDTSRVYNGAKQTILSSEEYTVITTLDNQVVETTFDKEINVTGSGTDVGSNYTMYFPKKEIGIHNEQYYVVGYENGKLSITKRPVTLTSGSAERVYNGEALTKKEVTASTGENEGFVKGQGAAYDVTGSQTNVGESKNTFSYTLNEGTKAENYTITKNEGKLKVTAATNEVIVTIKENAGTETYDGTEKTVTGYTVTDISNKLYTEKDFKFNGKAEVKGTDAGTYDMELKPENFENKNNNFSNVKFVIEDGQLVINKRPVTLTSEGGSKPYDGTPLTKPIVTVTGDGFVAGEVTDIKATGSVTYVSEGEVTNTITYTEGENFKASNYDIQKAEGKLSITAAADKVTVTITGNKVTEKYDGTEKTAKDYTVSISNPLYTATDFEFKGNAEVKGTDASTYDMGLNKSQFKNKNSNFSDSNVEFVVNDGQLVINPRPVTLTSEGGSKPYDGTALTKPEVAVGGDGFVKGEVSDIKATGSVTYVSEGEVTNTITYTEGENFKASNYDIQKAEGKLSITAVTDKVTVTITEKSDTVTYDSKEHTVTGYKSITADNPLYDVEDSVDETPTANWAANGTDAGEYPVGIEAGDFENTNKNFSNVTFVVEDGSLTITPAQVTLQAPIQSKTYDGTPLEATQFGHSYLEGVNFADDFAAVILTGSQTLVGSSASLITGVIPEEGKKLTNYNFTFVPGTLTVTDDTDDDPKVITKTHTPKDTGYNLGETVTFTVSVTNIYNEQKEVTLEEQPGVTFVDPQGAAIGTKATKTLEPGEKWTIQATYTITLDDILADGFTNKVKANFKGGKNWNAEDYVETRDPYIELDVTKTADVDKAALGQTITYTITVDYQSNVPGKKVEVKDPLTGLETSFTTEEALEGKTVTFTTTYTVTEQDVKNGIVKNTATVKSELDNEWMPADVETPTFAPITIKPKDVTATYNGAAITGKDVEITSGKLLEGHKLSAAVIGSGVNAGSYELTLDPEKIKIVDANNKDVSEMYARTILPGKLIINKRSVLITSQSATKTYDGSALTRPAVTITGDGFVPGELAKAEATGSITNVGSTPNTIRYTTTGAFNAANYSIALSVGTLTVTEKPKPEPRRTFNLTISYVYQNGKRAAASYNRGGLKNGETFDITSPVIAGYTASETVVSGTIYNRDIKVTVIYTADGVNLDDYGVPLGLGNITMNVGDCFE